MRRFTKLLKLAAKASKHYYQNVDVKRPQSDLDYYGYVAESVNQVERNKQRYGHAQSTKFAGQKQYINKDKLND